MSATKTTTNEETRLTAVQFKDQVLEPLADKMKHLVDASYRAGYGRAMYELKKKEDPPMDKNGNVITKANINQEASALSNEIKDLKKAYSASMKKKRAAPARKGRGFPIPIFVSDFRTS